MNTVKQENIWNFRETLWPLPPNIRHINSHYRDWPIAEIIAEFHDKTISQSTIHRHLQRLRNLYNWPINNLDEMEDHKKPFDRLNIARPDPGESRDPFSLDEIPLIVGCYLC